MNNNSYKKLFRLHRFLEKEGYTDSSKHLGSMLRSYASEDSILQEESSEGDDVIVLGDGTKIDLGGTAHEDHSPDNLAANMSNESVPNSYLTSDKESVIKLQKKLIEAGFALPRYGADGLHGSETNNAIKQLLRRASDDGLYFGTISGTIEVDETVSSLLEYYIEHKPSSDSLSSQPSDQKALGGVLYLGDSQMVGHLGRALMKANGPGKRIAESGKTASWLVSNQSVTEALKKAPRKIIISLNGNGTQGTKALIDLIQAESPDSFVVWTGAPPPIFMKGRKTWAGYLKTFEKFAQAYTLRKKRNDNVRAMIPYQWAFIDPYDYIKYNEPLDIEGSTYASGYTCENCDGIHLPSTVASRYVNSVSILS